MKTKRTYIVTAATGHVGGGVARALLEHGHAVRVLGRNRERLRNLSDLGATPFVGDMRDSALMEELFRGAMQHCLYVKVTQLTETIEAGFPLSPEAMPVRLGRPV
jgi:uncharacterized protein YbjT (DUF2867 family)